MINEEAREYIREYARERYAARCQSEEYREKVRRWARENYQRKKEKLIEEGKILRERGRPRKYNPLPAEMLAVLSQAGITVKQLAELVETIKTKN